jgi:hypothetical protein
MISLSLWFISLKLISVNACNFALLLKLPRPQEKTLCMNKKPFSTVLSYHRDQNPTELILWSYVLCIVHMVINLTNLCQALTRQDTVEELKDAGELILLEQMQLREWHRYINK